MHRPTPAGLRQAAAAKAIGRSGERALYAPAGGEAREIDAVHTRPRVEREFGSGRFTDIEHVVIVAAADAPSLAEGDVFELAAGRFVVAEIAADEDPLATTKQAGLRQA